MNATKYETQNESDFLRFTFLSKGKKEIQKLIVFTPLENVLNYGDVSLTMYNLGFGDWDDEKDDVNDLVNSNNGDMLTIVNTVLNTIPVFFSKYDETCIHITGSDERRKRIYSSFLSKNLETFSEDYLFYGIKEDKTFEVFEKNIMYEKIVFFPRII